MTFCNDFIKRGELSNDPTNAKPETPVFAVHDDVVRRIEEQVGSVVVGARVKTSTPQVAITTAAPGSAIVTASCRNEDAVPINP